MKELLKTSEFWIILFYMFWLISYIVNLVKFIQCDFESPWKDEIIHGIGVFFAFPSLITAWL